MSCAITIVLSGTGTVKQSIIAGRAEHDAVIEGYTVERVEMNGQVLNTIGIVNPVPTEITELRGAVARGWTHDANSAKVMDPILVEAIVTEVCEYIRKYQQGATDCPTCGLPIDVGAKSFGAGHKCQSKATKG